jgi:hypothetical protein
MGTGRDGDGGGDGTGRDRTETKRDDGEVDGTEQDRRIGQKHLSFVSSYLLGTQLLLKTNQRN